MAVEAAKIVINVSAEGTQQAAAGLEQVDKKVSGINDSLKKFVESGGIQKVAQAIISFASDVTKAFGEAETASKRLEAVAQMRGLDGASRRFTTLSNEMQKLTGVSGELVQNISAELLAQGKSEAMTKKMIKAAADLSAVTGDDLNTSIEMLNGSLSGQARALARTNPELKALTEEQLKSGAAIDIIAQKYNGMAESMSGTMEVSNKLRDETLGDLAESFGQFLAPAVTLVNEAFINMAQTGIQIMDFVNQMPGPLKVATVAIGLFTAGVVALAIAQASGLAITIKKSVADAVSIVKLTAQTIATWAQYAAQMAVNAALAVTNPALWVGVAAAVALTGATIALVASQVQQATATKETGVAMTETTRRFRELYAAAKAWDDARKASDNQWKTDAERARAYASALGDVSVARRGIQALENAGIITRKESLQQQIEQEKKALDLTIERAKQLADPGPMLRNAQQHRNAIAQMQAQLDGLNQSRNDAEEKYRDNLKATMDYFNQRQEEAIEEIAAGEQLKRDQFAQTFAMLNEHFDEYGESIEDAEGARQEAFEQWLTDLDEVKSKYSLIFSAVTTGVNAIGTIMDNLSQQNLINLQAELEAQKEVDDAKLQALIDSGATEEEIETLKATLDADALVRQKEFEKTKKKSDREAAIRARDMAVFQALLNVPIMIMEGIKAWSILGPAGAAIGAGIYGGLAAVQVAAAASTPIPAAQMGGEFIVPPGFEGDSGLLRVNSGEQVSVQPVRDSGTGDKRMTLSINGRDFEGYLEEVLNSGRITIRRQGVIRYA